MTTMNASSTGSGGSSGGRRHLQQQQQSGALDVQHATRNSSSSEANAFPWRTPSPVRSSGVRRRREESVEIEELDSDTMRQNSYNYFQRYTARPSAPAYNSSGSHGSRSNGANATFAFSAAERTSPARRTGSSRKRQRTLADQLDELCIGGVGYMSRRGGGARSGNYGDRRESASSVDAMMDSDSSSDERRDDAEDEDNDSASNRSELMVYGGVPSMKGFFFGSSRRKPMDRVFRHYAAVANQAASAADMNGNELVLFRRGSPAPPPSFLVSLPQFMSLSPQELEALTRQEKSKRASIVELSSDDNEARGRDGAGHHGRHSATASSAISGAYRSRSGSGSWSASSTNSPPFRAMGVPHTDSMEDFDMDGEDEPKQPHLSGDVSHSEWFLSDDDEL